MNNKKIKQTIATKAQDYKIVFGTELGKKVLYDIMKKNGALTSSFNENPYATAYNEGQRSVWLEIIKQLRFDVDKFEKMMEQGEKNYDDSGNY